LRILVASDQLLQPIWRRHSIVVNESDHRSARRRYPTIPRSRQPAWFSVLHDDHARYARARAFE
jgi:hypothetical protein